MSTLVLTQSPKQCQAFSVISDHSGSLDDINLNLVAWKGSRSKKKKKWRGKT